MAIDVLANQSDCGGVYTLSTNAVFTRMKEELISCGKCRKWWERPLTRTGTEGGVPTQHHDPYGYANSSSKNFVMIWSK